MKTRISNRSEALVLAISAISAIALAGAIAVVLLGSPKPRLVPGQQGPSSPVGQPITVISWNICSDVRTWCPSGGEPEVLAEAITETIRTHEPDAVFLQEVC